MSHPLIEKTVVVMCANYIYTGRLIRVAPDSLVLAEPSIIYETGKWSDADWKMAERLPTDEYYVERSGVEGMFAVKR